MHRVGTEIRPAEILLVEDNLDDVTLTRESFKEGSLVVNLHHAANGQEAMAFLRKEGKYADAPTPDLLLLDLNMPVMDGRQVMAEIVADPKLNHIPVVVLTTSHNDQEVLALYRQRISSYVTKPVDFARFVEVIQGIKDYWFKIVVLPHAPES
ncbi:MAG: response regulator [Planctomycetota bacterium]|nr:response regulator [Planctomycetota bacterium]